MHLTARESQIGIRSRDSADRHNRGRIKYQLVVVFMQAAATAIAAILFVRLAVARYLIPAHQFTRSRL